MAAAIQDSIVGSWCWCYIICLQCGKVQHVTQQQCC